MMKTFWSSAAPGLLMGSNSYAQPEMLFWWVFSEKSCKHTADCGCRLLFAAVWWLLKWQSECGERGKKQSHRVCCVLHAFDFCASWYIRIWSVFSWSLSQVFDVETSDLLFEIKTSRLSMVQYCHACPTSNLLAIAFSNYAVEVLFILVSNFLFTVLNIIKGLIMHCAGLSAVGFRSQ